MKTTYRKIQFLSNIATIVIAVLLGLIAVKLFFFPVSESAGGNSVKPSNSASPINVKQPDAQITTIGKAVPIENINWKQNKKTLVLYLSTTCRFCKESSPFYQKLVQESQAKGVKLIAVLPQPVEEAKNYFKEQNVKIEEIYNVSLAPIGVRGTPALLMVNENGIVSEHWRGKLTEAKETEVLSKLSS